MSPDPGNAETRVSLILTLLNEEHGLEKLMRALLEQSRLPDEIVIVDGGSRDRTPDLLHDYARRYPLLRVYIEPGVNIARGRNLAIERATGGIVAVTDGGCIPGPHWLEEITAPLRTDENVAAVSGRIVVDAASRFERFSGLLSMPEPDSVAQRSMFYGRSSAFRRRLWQKVGGYPDWLYTAEDSLFALRARQLGFKVVHAPRAELYWRPRPTWWKVAKMFFLYGRGNGRINWGSPRGSLYWLRYHALWAVTLALGAALPYLWLATAATWIFLYHHMVGPSIRRVRERSDDPWRELYVPALVFVRNIATNLGFLYGHYEFKRDPEFRMKLAQYTAGGAAGTADSAVR